MQSTATQCCYFLSFESMTVQKKHNLLYENTLLIRFVLGAVPTRTISLTRIICLASQMIICYFDIIDFDDINFDEINYEEIRFDVINFY